MPADTPLRFSDARPRYARVNVTPTRVGSSSDFRGQKIDAVEIDGAREKREGARRAMRRRLPTNACAEKIHHVFFVHFFTTHFDFF